MVENTNTQNTGDPRIKESSSSIEEERKNNQMPDDNGASKHRNALKKGIARFFLGNAVEPTEDMIGGKLLISTINKYN